MKKILFILALATGLFSCEDQLVNSNEVSQKPGKIMIKGYSTPGKVQLSFNGSPLLINNLDSYSGNIETTLDFVLDKGETNRLGIYDATTGNEIASYNVSYDNIADYEEFYFFNLPGIFLKTYAVKPTVNLGKVGFVFIFPNLGEFSGYGQSSVKGVLKKQDGTVLATIEKIGKEEFSELKIYNFFSNSAPVFLELYKLGTDEPYSSTQTTTVQLIQTPAANMIVLQEQPEGNIKGDIDIVDYL